MRGDHSQGLLEIVTGGIGKAFQIRVGLPEIVFNSLLSIDIGGGTKPLRDLPDLPS
ncbi:MAG TPA: hypothetical protein VMH05_21025 [Bryobacteraceae bacterium]|nr:hypothetical protein [Bryobacteraceae bacterium]